MLTLIKLPGDYFVQRIDVNSSSCLGDIKLQDFILNHNFISITRTDDEVSIIIQKPLQLNNVDYKVEGPWCMYRVAGQLDFSLTGIISSLTSPLAAATISVFTSSTYDTDYILIKTEKSIQAEGVWIESGFSIIVK
jgi:hypothetical protein